MNSLYKSLETYRSFGVIVNSGPKPLKLKVKAGLDGRKP